MKRFLYSLLLFSLPLLVAAQTTVVDIIVESEAHTILETAVVQAGLAETLAGEGPFTVFAPSDDAFAALPEGTIEALLADPEGALTDILLYHVVGASALSTDLADGMKIATLGGDSVLVSITEEGVFINDAMVTLADLVADNGVVHVINAVLLPPPSDPMDNSQVILDFETPETSTDFQYFGSSLEPMLTEVIANPNPSGINVSDSVAAYIKAANSETWAGAFSNPAPAMMIDASNGGEVCIDVHMDHIGNIAFKLENGDGAQNWTVIKENTKVNEWETICFNFDTLSQDQTTIPATGNVYSTIVLFFDFGSNADTAATYYLDNIIVHPGEEVETNTVLDIIVNSEVHTTLETAVLAAGLDEALSGEGPFTVFAPTDDAFSALPADVIAALLAAPEGDLTDILLYHVAAGSVLSTDLSDGMEVTTLNGKTATVTINENGVFINDAQVTLADLTADNGVVHVINAVLLPPSDPVDTSGVILDFETPETSTNFQYFGSSLEPMLTEVIANPNPSGINVSDSVAAYIKAANSETWAGAFSNPAPARMIDATNGGEVCIDVHMDHIGNIGFKLENGNGAENWTVIKENTLVNEWETICFNFDTLSQDQTTIPARGNVYSTIVLFFDFGSNADTAATSYFDNIVVHPGEAVETTTVVDIIVESEVHTILETAVLTAGLDEALSGAGPFTVFAPTDAAFAALPQETIAALLASPEGELTQILLYHVANGKALSTDLADGMMVETLNGQSVTVTINEEGVFINDAQVILADLEADNGVVHVLDAVLFPADEPEDNGIIIDFETPETTTQFQYFGSSLEPELTEVIMNPNPTGINTSDNVGQFVKAANSEVWAGAFSNPNPMKTINAVSGDQICMDVHMDHLGNVMMKLENGNGAQNWAVIQENTVVNEWETLCYEFDTPSQDQTTIPASGNTYNTVVIFFDFGANSNVDVTSYFDNIVVKSTSTSVNDLNQVNIVSIFPNPTSDYLQIDHDLNVNNGQYLIYSLDGKLVKTIRDNNSRINVSDLQSGTYFLQFRDQQKLLFNSKFVKK